MKRRIEGEVKWVRRIERPKIPAKKVSGSAYYGIVFENKFSNYMTAKYENAIAHPWLEFEDDNGTGLCQPDLILTDPFIIFELKVLFTPRKAYGELKRLYSPVVCKWLEKEKPKLVQVCHHLKPSAKKTRLVDSMEDVINHQSGLLTWKWSAI